jgi:hypothetical protein
MTRGCQEPTDITTNITSVGERDKNITTNIPLSTLGERDKNKIKLN